MNNKIKLVFTSILALAGFVAALSYGQTNLNINAQEEKQTIDGFGASDAWVINPLIKKWESENKSADITKLADLLFSQDKGIGLSAWRFNIGAGSAEQGGNSNIADSIRRAELFKSSATAAIDTTKQAGQVRLLKEANSRGVSDYVAFANSPPVWATKNGLAHPNDGSGVGSTNLKSDQVDNFSKFLVDVVVHLRNTVKVPVNYISPINEPTWEWQGKTQEGNRYNNSDMKTVYRSLAKEIKNRNLTGVEIDGVETVEFTAALSDSYKTQFDGSLYTGGMNSSGQGTYKNYIDDFLGDSEMKTILGNKISIHGYFSEASSKRLGTLRDLVYQNVTSVSPGAKIWMSELSILGGAEDIRKFEGNGWNVDDMDYALHIARVIHRDFSRLNANAWHWWTAVTPYDYKDGLIKVNSNLDASSMQSSKVLWAVGNYSRFIRPGYTRISLPNVDNISGLMATAYKSADESKVVVVVVNAADTASSVKFSVSGLSSTLASFDTYTTNANNNLASTGSVNAADAYSVPAKSVVTFVGSSATVQPKITASFSLDKTSIYTGESVTFTDTSTNFPTSLEWTFEGGSPATGSKASETVTYYSPGKYKVTLKATNATSTDTSTKVDAVTVTDRPVSETLCNGAGQISRKVWTSIASTGSPAVDEAVSSIPLNSTPTTSDLLSSFEIPKDVGDNYGTRVAGYVCAPLTGNYTFWIAGDNDAELWLSSDESAANKILIASVKGWTNSREWEKYASQKSATKSLVAGKKYYVLALQKESTGGDNLAVRWKTPSTDTSAPIAGTYLLPEPVTSSSSISSSSSSSSSTNNGLPATGQSATYKIVSQLSSKIIDVAGQSTSNGATVHQWADVSGTNQQWVITGLGSGTYTIKNLNSNLCLDMPGSSTTNGTAVTQYTCNNGANQKWKAATLSSGIFHIKNSNSNLCLDVSGSSTSDGAKILQWTCSTTANNQKWMFVKVN